MVAHTVQELRTKECVLHKVKNGNWIVEKLTCTARTVSVNRRGVLVLDGEVGACIGTPVTEGSGSCSVAIQQFAAVIGCQVIRLHTT